MGRNAEPGRFVPRRLRDASTERRLMRRHRRACSRVRSRAVQEMREMSEASQKQYCEASFCVCGADIPVCLAGRQTGMSAPRELLAGVDRLDDDARDVVARAGVERQLTEAVGAFLHVGVL